MQTLRTGIGIDGGESNQQTALVKKKGKVKNLEDEILSQAEELYFDKVHDTHVGIAHTRWATHGVPSAINSHPQVSFTQKKKYFSLL